MENSQDIGNLFAKASKLDESKMGYLGKWEWEAKKKIDGAKRFKRKALGLCGLSSVKSLEKMAQLLYDTGVVSSVEEGRELTPSLVGKSIIYSDSNIRPIGGELGFEEVRNSEGQVSYRLYVFGRF
mgnify:CR=1 FL=1